MARKGWFVAAVFAALGQGVCMPAEAVEAARCGWDPACLCIEWFGDAEARIEVRCPGGEQDGWTEPGSSADTPNAPDFVDPRGSFVGDGDISTTILQGGPLPDYANDRIDAGKYRASQKLRNDPQCKALFQGSPVTENGAWLASKVIWRDGTGVPHPTAPVVPCDLDGAVAWAESTEEHKLQVFLCPEDLDLFSDDEMAAIVIHETLHVAGQSESGSNNTAGPGDPPRSSSITRVVAKACNLLWVQPLD